MLPIHFFYKFLNNKSSFFQNILPFPKPKSNNYIKAKIWINSYRTGYSKSESESSRQSWSFDVFVNLLLVDWLFNDFPGAEGDVSRRVEINGSLSEGPESCSGGFDFSELKFNWKPTLASFSFSTTLTILPNDGITLILMLLTLMNHLPVLADSVLEWHDMLM